MRPRLWLVLPRHEVPDNPRGLLVILSLGMRIEVDGIEITVELPYMPQSLEISSPYLQTPRIYGSPLSSMPFMMLPVKIECLEECGKILLTATVLPWFGIADGRKSSFRHVLPKKVNPEVRELLERGIAAIDIEKLKALRAPYKLIGQLLANVHAAKTFVGVFDGKPAFNANSYMDQLWRTMAELADKQLPGFCPVCGKVIGHRQAQRCKRRSSEESMLQRAFEQIHES